MGLSDIRTARDYNRALAAPIRWMHVMIAAVAQGVRAVGRWALARGGWAWARIGLLGLIGFAVLLPFDGVIADAARRVDRQTWGDLDRVLHWLQEYGQGPSIVLIAVLVWLLDPARRRALAPWLMGIGVTWVLLTALKLAIGRPRPKFDDPWVFLGPFGAYPLGPGLGVHHAWEFWGRRVIGSGDLWSMPSSHAAYAAVTSCFLGALYPRIRGVVIALAVTVCVCRVLYGAHYASDVVVGATIGVASGRIVMTRWLTGLGAPVSADSSHPAR